MSIGVARFEGADRFGGVDIGFIRSQAWWSVGVLVMEARQCCSSCVPEVLSFWV